MTEDLLARATRALRESAESHDQGASFTRARVMASLHQRRQRLFKRTFLLPLAAVLIGSTAWAGISGRLPKMVQALARVVGVETSVSESVLEGQRDRLGRTQPKSPSRLVSTQAAPQDSVTLAPSSGRSELAPPVGPEPERTNRPALSVGSAARPSSRLALSIERREAPPLSAGSALPVLTGVPETVLAPPEEQVLYRTAHRIHFDERDWARALTAWDNYIRRAPGGRFIPEALYNRALCLVHLGQKHEAMGALRPFSSGQFGAYRQKEATTLITALAAEK